MVAISIQIEGQMGLTWPLWQGLIRTTDDLGFAGIYRSDHFTNAGPPDLDSLEMLVSLTYLADHSQNVKFGPLVAPFTYRHPAMLARQAAALDDLSHGRMVLGVGAGWNEYEHHKFGYDLPEIGPRMDRLEEGLEVITLQLKSDQQITFEGKYYQLREALLLPRPQRSGGPRILVGGNGKKRTLQLAARYADIWNAIALSPADFRERSQDLDRYLKENGRKPNEVRRTMMTSVFFGKDQQELKERQQKASRIFQQMGEISTEQAIEFVTSQNGLAGTPEMILEQIQRFKEAGVEEIMLQWFDIDDLDGLKAFAKTVVARA